MNKSLIFLPFLISSASNYFLMQPESYEKQLLLQPPSYVFGIVWSFIYLIFGLYIYRIFHLNEPYLNFLLIIWICNFALNLLWSPIVFNYKKYKIGVYMIVLMIGTLISLLVSTQDVFTRNLIIPYLTWLLLALVLNIELARKHQN